MKQELHGSFPCPKCGGKSQVKDSRPTSRGIRRRRVCLPCGHRWTTFETSGERAFTRDFFDELQATITTATKALEAVGNVLSAMEKPADE